MPIPSSELKNEIVRAGAGAGKTQALTKKVLAIAEQWNNEQGRLPRIVVTTFTKKATEELRERLLSLAIERGQAPLIDFVMSRSNLHISTIHGVFSRFIREFGHLMDLDVGFKVLDKISVERRSRRLIRDVIVENPPYSVLLEHYSIQQLARMSRTFVDRVGGFDKMAPVEWSTMNELYLAHHRRLSLNLANVCGQILSETTNEKWITACQDYKKIADYFSSQLDTINDISAFSPQDFADAVKEVIKPKFLKKTNPPFSEDLKETLFECISDISELHDEEFSAENLKKILENSKIFYSLANDYMAALEAERAKTGHIEMSEFEKIILKAQREFPELIRVYSAQWDFWLVDEFQDTSPLQVKLLRELAGKSPTYFVGDPQQSIYLFRGARSEVFSEKEIEIKKTGGVQSYLTKNYRSEPELLFFINDFFSHFSQKFMDMEAKEVVEDPKKVVASIHKLPKEAEDPWSPVADKILTGVKAGERFESYCVLTRKNSEASNIARYLEKLNIPTQLHSSQGFFRRREILDILSLLKFLLNPYDNKNLIRLLRSPWVNVPDSELTRALASRPMIYWDHLQKALPEVTAVKKLQELRQNLQLNGVYQTLKEAIIQLGLVEASHLHDSTGRRESNIWKFLSLLKEKERQPGFNYLDFVLAALEGGNSPEGDEEDDAVAALEPNRVNLMTIHKAKGLKFKHVIIPNMGRKPRLSETKSSDWPLVIDEKNGDLVVGMKLGEDKKFHHSLFAKMQLKEMSRREEGEHQRLLYVAVTRAVSSVTLLWQTPLERGSWAETIDKDLTLGLKTTEHYSVFVSEEQISPAKWAVEINTGGAARPAWQEARSPNTAQSQRRMSVTRLLEEQNSAFKSAPGKKSDSVMKTIEKPVFGLKLHSILERLKYEKNLNIREYVENWFPDRVESFSKAVAYVLNLSSPPLKKLIEGGSVEWGFQLNTRWGTLEGQIDLWGSDGKNTWVVDYKSGSSHSAEKAFRQLDLYSLALRKLGVSGDIQLAVIFALEEKTLVRPAKSVEEIQKEFNL